MSVMVVAYLSNTYLFLLFVFYRKARFFSWDLLQEHKNVLEKRKKCPLCGQCFGRSALDRHLETRHGKARLDHSANQSPSPALL